MNTSDVLEYPDRYGFDLPCKRTLRKVTLVSLFIFALNGLLWIEYVIAGEIEDGATTSQSRELSVNSLLHPFAEQGDHARIWNKVQKPLYDELETRTGGEVKIKQFFDGSLTPVSEIHSSVLEGKADIGFSVVFSSMVEDFPIAGLFRLSRPEKHTSNASYILWKMMEEWPEMQEEWSDFKVLYNYVFFNSGLALTSGTIQSLADLKGKKILDLKSPWVNKQLLALGAIPVPAYSLEEIRLSLEAGEIDGFVFDSPDFVVGYGFTPYVKQYVDLGLAPAITYTVMNKDSWNSLSPDQQAIFNDVFGEKAHRHSDKKIAEKDKGASDVSVNEYGVEWYHLSPADRSKAVNLLQPVREEYTEFLNRKGYDGREIMARFEKLYNENID